MQILAIDPSSKSTGIAVFSDQELIHYECITAGSANLFKRINKMVEGIENILKTYSIEKVVMEEVIPDDVKGNNTVFKALIYLQGFIVAKLDEYKLKPVFFVSSEWRKKCGIHTGRGVMRESLKPKDQAFVKSQFGLTVNDDIADAICIGFAAVGGVVKEPQVVVSEHGFEIG